MTLRLQIILAVILLLMLVSIIRMVKKNRLSLKYALPWMGVVVCLLIVDAFPKIVEIVSGVMGIELPVNMLLFFGLLLALIICFYLTTHVSKQTNEIRQLSQEVALLREEMEKMR